MSSFLTRPGLAQPQPQVAQLPFSQFGGQRPQIQGDTIGGIAFPDAGQQQPPAESPLSQFMLPTGLTNEELSALLGKLQPTKQNILAIDPFFQNHFQPQFQQQTTQPQTQTTSTIPTGGIAFEGSGGFDKFNPIGAGGFNPNKLGGGF